MIELSNRARSILGYLVFETGVTLYFLWKVTRLPADTALLSGPMFKLILSIIFISIIGGIVIAITVDKTKDKEAADERDRNIEIKADSAAYHTLVWAIGFFLSFLYIGQGFIDFPHYRLEMFIDWFTFTPLRVLTAMIFILWLSETVKYTTQLRLYKRGY